jgi:tRNA G18 (ribose-2'-O)-methylase SpoU
MTAIQQVLETSSYDLDSSIGAVILQGSLDEELNAGNSSEQLRAIYGLLARVQRLVKNQLFPGRGKSSGKNGRKQHRLDLKLLNLEQKSEQEERKVVPPSPPVTVHTCNGTIQIEDAADTRVDPFRLREESSVLQADVALKDNGLFLVQSHLVVEVLLRHSIYETVSVLATQTKLDKLAAHFTPCTQRPCVCPQKYAALDACIQEVGGYGFPVDCMALAKRPTQDAPLVEHTNDASHSTIVALERLTSAENVGSITRSAVAFGASALLVCPACADPLNRKSVRASMGAILRLPFTRAKSWSEELCCLKLAGYTLLATCLSPKAIRFDELPADLRWQKVVLLFGNEGDGLSAATLHLADYHVQIEMQDPHIDSLSVGHAAAIALSHAANSRKRSSTGVHPHTEQ